MAAEAHLIDLLDRFLAGDLDLPLFEKEFLHVSKYEPIENELLRKPLDRAFFAVEGFDLSITPETESPHDLSYLSMLRILKEVREEIAKVLASRPPSE